MWETKNDYFHDNAPKINIKLKKYHEELFIETTGIEIQIQRWGGNIK